MPPEGKDALNGTLSQLMPAEGKDALNGTLSQ